MAQKAPIGFLQAAIQGREDAINANWEDRRKSAALENQWLNNDAKTMENIIGANNMGNVIDANDMVKLLTDQAFNIKNATYGGRLGEAEANNNLQLMLNKWLSDPENMKRLLQGKTDTFLTNIEGAKTALSDATYKNDPRATRFRQGLPTEVEANAFRTTLIGQSDDINVVNEKLAAFDLPLVSEEEFKFAKYGILPPTTTGTPGTGTTPTPTDAVGNPVAGTVATPTPTDVVGNPVVGTVATPQAQADVVGNPVVGATPQVQTDAVGNPVVGATPTGIPTVPRGALPQWYDTHNTTRFPTTTLPTLPTTAEASPTTSMSLGDRVVSGATTPTINRTQFLDVYNAMNAADTANGNQRLKTRSPQELWLEQQEMLKQGVIGKGMPRPRNVNPKVTTGGNINRLGQQVSDAGKATTPWGTPTTMSRKSRNPLMFESSMFS